jgi:hypothetical protein
MRFSLDDNEKAKFAAAQVCVARAEHVTPREAPGGAARAAPHSGRGGRDLATRAVATPRVSRSGSHVL